jgi:hypothetical protein
MVSVATNSGPGYDRIPWSLVPVGLLVRQKGLEGYLRVRALFQVGARSFPSITVGGRGVTTITLATARFGAGCGTISVAVEAGVGGTMVILANLEIL